MEPIPQTPTCTPYQQFGSWVRRHVPVLVLAGVLLAYLFGPHLLQTFTLWIHGAPPITAGQGDLEGSQVAAANQAGGWKQFGAITSVMFAGTAYFSTIVFVVWFLMHYITPGLPTWAKKHFTAGFDEANSTIQLQEKWQYAIYLAVWLGLLLLYAVCILSASLAQ
jgi:hypothetical protein